MYDERLLYEVPVHEEEFPSGMSYEEGFDLFVGLAVVTGLIFTFLAGFYVWKLDRSLGNGSRGYGRGQVNCAPTADACCTSLVVFLFLASAVLVAWGGTARPVESKKESGLAAIIIGSILVLLFGGILYFGPWHEGLSLRSLWQFDLFLTGVALLVVPGLVVLAIYCKRMMTVEDFNYHGPMRITGYTVDFNKGHISCRSGGVCDGYEASSQVEWGMSWGCPDEAANYTCTTLIVEPECTQFTTENCEARRRRLVTSQGTRRLDCGTIQSDEDARSKAEHCIKEKYDLYAWLKNISFDQPNYDPAVRPDKDPTWPWAIFYGDCSKCKAILSSPLGDAKDLKEIGIGLAVAGASLLVFTFFAALLVRNRRILRVPRIDQEVQTNTIELRESRQQNKDLSPTELLAEPGVELYSANS